MANVSQPKAARGWKPAGSPTVAIPRSAHSAPSAPPPVTATIRQSRSTAWWNADSVSEVLPEYDETTTRVCGPANAGRIGDRTTSTGTSSSARKACFNTSPATAEPPIPQNTTDVTSASAGRCSAARPTA